MPRTTAGSRIAAVLFVIATAFAAPAGAEEWDHTLIVYGMGASLDGESQVGPLSVQVDISMSDVFDSL